MRFITFILFLSVIFPLYNLAQSQPASEWIASKKISWNNYGYSISTGPEGNVYVSGAFTGPYRNPGPQDMGCFLTCYNYMGVELWHKEYYSIIGAIAAFNVVDSEGNVILAGPGLFKFDNTGTLIDSFPAAGLRRCEALSIDPADNIIIAGRCYGDSVIGNIRVIGDSFIAKYSSTGTQAWAIPCYIDFGPNQDFDLAVDEQGNIFTCGGFVGTLNLSFDLILNSKHRDGFVIKYDTHGSVMWAKCFGGAKSEYPHAITVDKKGGIYITGTYYGIMVAESSSTLAQQGVSDIFVIKYDADGNLQWLKSGGGADQDKVWEMTVDEHDNIFLSGSYDSPGTFVWEGLPIATKENDKGGLFVIQLDTDGNPVAWLNAQGGHFKDLICDNKGNLFATGACGSKIELAGKTLESDGGMLLAKLSYDMNNKVGMQAESFSKDLFQIFPNPGKIHFNIQVSNELCQDATITVYETSGKCILNSRTEGCSDKNLECIAPPGIYLVELRSGAGRQTRKVIIQ